MIPAAIEVVGGIRIAEQAGEPEAQIARVDRHDDVALSLMMSCERAGRSPALAPDRRLGPARCRDCSG
jgi:hypothetical protein